jgi:hypothetical protein
MIEQAQGSIPVRRWSVEARIMPQLRAVAPLRAGSGAPGPQPVQDGRVGAGHIHDLSPACRSGDQCDSVTADTERIGYRGERCRGGLPVHGARGYPDHQGAIVLPAHARARGSGADPYR